jgi:hypothetical protein
MKITPDIARNTDWPLFAARVMSYKGTLNYYIVNAHLECIDAIE